MEEEVEVTDDERALVEKAVTEWLSSIDGRPGDAEVLISLGGKNYLVSVFADVEDVVIRDSWQWDAS